MNPAEAAALLAAIAGNDNREVTEAGARAWAAALPDVELGDALRYLPRYYRAAARDGRNWIYPGDVLTGVREMWDEARRTIGDAAYGEAMTTLDPNDPAVQDRGLDLYALRARRDAMAEWAADHPKPGEEIDRRERDAEQARALGISGPKEWG